MKFRTAPGLRLTDFTNGSLEDETTGRSVPATDLARAIAAHFRDGADWTDFAGAGDPDAETVFSDLCEAGVLLADGDAPDGGRSPGPVPERPLQTMFAAPFRRLQDILPREIVFLGAPFDIATTGFPGARFGPEALRAASVERYQCRFDLVTGGLLPWNVPALGGAVLRGARLSDAGDVVYHPGEPATAYYERLRAAVGAVYRAGGFPVVIGGDHSISYATLRDPSDALVHLDAHSDLAELVPGHGHHHGNVLTRLLAEGRVGRVHHLGLRDTAGWDTARAGTVARSVGDLEREGWIDGIAGEAVFVSLDVDVLDPSVLPGTGTPVMGGLSLRQLCQVLARIAAEARPVGLDIVELCPMRDHGGLSERAVVEALLCFLAVHHKFHGAAP